MKKNIHTLAALTPTKLYEFGGRLFNSAYPTEAFRNRNVYITSDEEIRDVRPHHGKWHLEGELTLNKFPDYLTDLSDCKLVLLTSDPILIADGVQEISDEFLNWFVNNQDEKYIEILEEIKAYDKNGFCISAAIEKDDYTKTMYYPNTKANPILTSLEIAKNIENLGLK